MFIKCESCGKTFQSSKDVFCPHCGAVATKSGTAEKSTSSAAYDYSGKFSPMSAHTDESCAHGGSRSYDEYGEDSRQKSFASGKKMHTSAGGFRSLADIFKTPNNQNTNPTKKTGNKKSSSLVCGIIFVVVAVFAFAFSELDTDNLFDGYDYGYGYDYETLGSKCVFVSPEVVVNPDANGYCSVYITYDGFYSDDDTGMLEDAVSSDVYSHTYADVFEKPNELGNGSIMSIGIQTQSDCIYIDETLECGKYYSFEDLGTVYCTVDYEDFAYTLCLPFDVLYITPQGEAKLYNIDAYENTLIPYTETDSAYSAESVAVVI